MRTPFPLKLLLWYYNRYIALDPWGKSAQEVRASVNGKGTKFKNRLNGPFIPVHQVKNQIIPVRNGEIPIRIYFPNDQSNLPVLIYYHGGGFVLYGLDSHDHVCRRLCRDNWAVVVSVDYRLAPEHKFPIPVHDSYDALLWVANNLPTLNGDKNKIVVVGDSAGGNLATVVSHLARNQNGPTIAAQVLVYPVLDARMQHPSIKENGKGYILTESLMHWFLEQYKRNDGDILDPCMSPLLSANFSNLPPTLIQVAGLDPLRDEGIDYAERLKAAGNHVQLTNYKGMTHSFFSMPGLSKRCVAAYEEINGFLSMNLKSNRISQQ